MKENMISAIDNIIVNVCSKKHRCEVLSADHKHNVRVSTTPANMLFPPSLPLKVNCVNAERQIQLR
ncbi:hypothetical protein T03_11639 [Trichinella britovi]|uniref:Uncharacterized protein n=1 Tax=Trichinella britovi TaxID=45882 RepID=A0A0V1DKP6_TRIBR|nr:hypothetical protein T03_11639 [Trichinella britovi]